MIVAMNETPLAIRAFVFMASLTFSLNKIILLDVTMGSQLDALLLNFHAKGVFPPLEDRSSKKSTYTL
jgi:hypothetical protein